MMRQNKNLMPDQRSVSDQLNDLVVLANKAGLYDAADWLQEKLKSENSLEFMSEFMEPFSPIFEGEES